MNRLKKTILIVAVLQMLILMFACSASDNKAESISQDENIAGSESSVSSVLESESSKINSDNDEVKTITFEVVVSENDTREYSITTEASNLQEALEQEDLIEGEDSSYGFFVTTVDGVTADDSKQEWWCLTKDGEEWVNGVSSTDIEDGDKYEFTLTSGY